MLAIAKFTITTILLLGFLQTEAQDTVKIKIYQDHFKEIINDSNRMMPRYLFDSLAYKFQDGISGTQVKDGKLIGTSLSIDEKGATANIGLARFHSLYLSGQVSGRGDNKQVSVFKDGKYQQTASFGGTLNLFLGQFSGKAYVYERILTDQRVKRMLQKYDTINLQNERMALMSFFHDLKCYDSANNSLGEKPTKYFLESTVTAGYLDLVDKGEKAIDTLKKLGLLKDDFDVDGEHDSIEVAHAGQLLGTIDTIRLLKKVYDVEKIFNEMPWTQFHILWLTGSGSYNISPEGVIHPELSGKDHYLSIYNHEYAKASLALNYSHINTYGKQFQITGSIGINFSSIRSFKEDEKIKLSKLLQYTQIANDSVLKTDFLSDGYAKIAARANVWSVELPITLLWNKSNIGLDIALRAGGNDPMGDNVGGQFGFFIPIDLKDNVPVWIEPVVKFQKLFDKGGMDIWRDNMSIGFNLSIALKKYTFIGNNK